MNAGQSLHVSVLGPFPGDRADALLGDRQIPELMALPHEGGSSIFPFVAQAVRDGYRRSVLSLSRAYAGTPRLFRQNGFSFYLAVRRRRHEIRSLYCRERAHVVEGLNRLQPDVVHANWTQLYALGALDSGRPTLLTVRDHAARMMHCLGVRYTANYLITRYVLRRARFLTAVSPHVARYVERLTDREIRVIPNCVPDSLVADAGEGADTAQRSDGAISIASALSAARFKNARAAIQAFAAVKRKIPRARYDLVGPGLEPNGPTAAWARRLGLDDGVKFHGPMLNSRFLGILAQAGVLFHPSAEESFGGPPLEGMALGKTVVAGKRAGGCPWVLDEGRAGVLVDERSPAAMAEQLVDILKRPEAYAERRRRALHLVRTRYSARAVSEAYQAAYEDVLANRARRAA